MGNVFFGIVGGEPFMHPQLLDMLAAHPDCYFQIFTNGQFITDERAKRDARSSATSRRSSASRATRSSATSAAAGPDVCSKTMQGHAELPEAQGLHRRLHQPVPDEHRRSAQREMGRSPDRDGRDVHLVPRLSADGPRRESGAVPDAGAAAPGPQVRGRDAGEEADHHRRRLLRRRRPGAVPGGDGHHATTSIRGATSSRARSCSSPRSRSTPSEADRRLVAGQVPAIGVPARLPRPGPDDHARLHRAGTARPARRSWSRSTGRRTRPCAAPPWRNWRR